MSSDWKTSHTSTTSEFTSNGGTGAVDLEKNVGSLKTALQKVRDESSETDWVLFGYEKNSDVLVPVDDGEGGLDDLCEELSDGKVLYSVIRLKIDGKRKFVFIVWTGDGVPAVKKGVVHVHANVVARFVGFFHLQINARSESDLDEERVFEKLRRASGANYDAGLRTEA